MKKTLFFLAALYITVVSCTKEKTDYEAEKENNFPEHLVFKEALVFDSEGYTISIETLNGAFYTGYNEFRLKIVDSKTRAGANHASVNFLPIWTLSDGSNKSCPHRYNLTYVTEGNYFSGYTVFSQESNPSGEWNIYLSIKMESQVQTIKKHIAVEKQINKNLNMTTFIGKDNMQYYIALIAPQKPKAGENTLVAGVYRYNPPSNKPTDNFPDPTQFSFSEMHDYTLVLDPRMPEASMGNHSSPNNKDLLQRADGLYQGVVNYTMTGNWTLNLIMLNEKGQILKGTVVPPDFTPGKEGIKSELHIDIVF